MPPLLCHVYNAMHSHSHVSRKEIMTVYEVNPDINLFLGTHETPEQCAQDDAEGDFDTP